MEVTRTIRNNKLHFTWGCSILLLKKKEKGPETGFLFFLMILIFFKNILILIITSPAIHYSQNVFRGFSILVCIGVQVFFGGFFLFFTPPLARDPLSRSESEWTKLYWPYPWGCKLMITELKLLTTLHWTIVVFILSCRLMLNRV